MSLPSILFENTGDLGSTMMPGLIFSVPVQKLSFLLVFNNLLKDNPFVLMLSLAIVFRKDKIMDFDEGHRKFRNLSQYYRIEYEKSKANQKGPPTIDVHSLLVQIHSSCNKTIFEFFKGNVSNYE